MDKIIQNESLYKFILTSMWFNEARDEKKIFELVHYGYNNCDIAKELNLSEGTIRNRKKIIVSRAKLLLKNTLD